MRFLQPIPPAPGEPWPLWYPRPLSTAGNLKRLSDEELEQRDAAPDSDPDPDRFEDPQSD